MAFSLMVVAATSPTGP